MRKYDYMQIGIASPEQIIEWCRRKVDGNLGEVKKHETINYRTLKPERDGLFCEIIFGPMKDYQCACGKSRKTGDRGGVCEKCKVELTESKVRRERMGFIRLAAPVVHTWYLRNTPSKIAILLDMKTRDVEDIVYLASYIVTDPGNVEELTEKQILTEQEYSSYQRRYGIKFKALTGAEAIKKLLQDLDLEELSKQLRNEIKGATKQRREKIIKRLDIVESFLRADEIGYITNPVSTDTGIDTYVEFYRGSGPTQPNCLRFKIDKAYDILSEMVLTLEMRVSSSNKSMSGHSNNFTSESKRYVGRVLPKNPDNKDIVEVQIEATYSPKFEKGDSGKIIGWTKDVFSEYNNITSIGAAPGHKYTTLFVSTRINKPEWMVMDVVPVIPPDLRPMVQLDGGRFATTDLNDLYRRIINRNNRLKKQFEQRAPNLITKNEKRMLQEAVDALIDNSKRNKKVVVDRNRPLKSLSDLLRGKQGRFRQNLLGKRVDYSGRSVIVVGPDLKMYQCGIPREMALILFKPFIISMLRKRDENNPEQPRAGIKRAKELIEKGAPEAMEALEKIVAEHPVLLNRAPTLHRLSIQAFEPKLVEGKAIRLHPLVTTAFNADFDGDQMPVHVPLSEEAQAEARLLMLASKNILAPKDGKPVVTPSQDMVLGNYYLTIEEPNVEKDGWVAKDINEVELAYENNQITLHSRIALPARALNCSRFTKEQQEKYLITTYGKIIFNTIFPKNEENAEEKFEEFPFVNEATIENLKVGTPDKYFVEKGANIKEAIRQLDLSVIEERCYKTNSDILKYFQKDPKNDEIFNIAKDRYNKEIGRVNIGPRSGIYQLAIDALNARYHTEQDIILRIEAKHKAKEIMRYIEDLKATDGAEEAIEAIETYYQDVIKDKDRIYKEALGTEIKKYIRSQKEKSDAAIQNQVSDVEAIEGDLRLTSWTDIEKIYVKDVKMIEDKIGDESFHFFEHTADLRNDCNARYINDISSIYQDLVKDLSTADVDKLYPTFENLNPAFNKKFLANIISEIFHQCRLAETSKALDRMKDLGFKYSTVAGITVSIFDVELLETKENILSQADYKYHKNREGYKLGTSTEEERAKSNIEVWTKSRNYIEDSIRVKMKDRATSNHIFMMADSGARGNTGNFTQLAGMRGLMARPSGESMEIPVRASFSEGLSMSEFFISTHGARKGSTDTALKTAESGYLTRRLVDVSHDITVTNEDCGTDKGVVVTALVARDGTEYVKLRERILGRFTSKPIYNNNNELVVDKGVFINNQIADKIIDSGIKSVEVRTLLTCDSPNGVCVKCYGSDLSTTDVVEKGEVVGIVAAQSIGEPGTQLTMRTFHSGGVAAGDDITQGLPRIQELFEARDPKGKAIISEIKGKVKEINQKQDQRYEIIIESPIPNNDKSYLTDSGKRPIVRVGQEIQPGDPLVEGMINPKELIRVSNVRNVESYILREVQKVYRAQGVEIADKHIEIIIKQMLQKVVVVDEGDTDLLPGTFVSKPDILKYIKDMYDQGKRIPIIKPVILGITRASLKADSFLSAASFQETTRVLTEAAIRGKKDHLEGLKENIIIGGIIPAGTGLIEEVELEYDEPSNITVNKFVAE